MKKLFLTLLALVMCFSACACGENNTEEETLSQESLKNIIIGIWREESDNSGLCFLFEEDGAFNYIYTEYHSTYTIVEQGDGTYEVFDSKIVLKFEYKDFSNTNPSIFGDTNQSIFGDASELIYENGKINIGKHSLSRQDGYNIKIYGR